VTPNDRRLREQAHKLISACTLFRGLGEQQRAQLLDRVCLRNYGAGETIFSMGDSGASLMAVVEGSVQIGVPSLEGKEIILAIMHAGDVFGEIGLLDGQERSADARAMAVCTLAILERRDVLRVFDGYPQAYFEVVQLLCQRIRRTTTQMAEVTLLDLPPRLARALLRVARAPHSDEEVKVLDRVKLSQRELGNIVGATRESVNKCLRNWQRSKIVEVQASGIRILDQAALEDLAEMLDH
jgi:CRP-like cAMP-binding protein